MHNKLNISQSIRGFFTWERVDMSTNDIIQSSTQPNLILNQGLDYVAARTYQENITSCAIGSGSTAPLTTDTGLSNELARTSTYDITYQPCATTLVGNVFSIQKTFKFASQTQDQQFGEIGWSYTDTPGNNLFSKAQILDTNGNPIILTIYRNQYLRVTYTLKITLSPSTASTNGAIIDGWPTSSGQSKIQYIGLRAVGPDGNPQNYDSGGTVNEPSQGIFQVFLSVISTALAAFGSAANRSGGTATTSGSISTYIPGTYSITKSGTFGRGVANSTLRSTGLGPSGSSSVNSTYVELFDIDQEKDTSYELTFNFVYTWGRS